MKHTIEIASVVRELPVREVAPGVRVALFNMQCDCELTEAAGKLLARWIPCGAEALLMPEGKATALLHVMGRESGLPTFVARKEKKPYMADPVVHVALKSITTDRMQTLFFGADDARRLRGKNVVVVDDVVSSGGTLKAVNALLDKVGAKSAGVMAIFTEGEERKDIITLGHLPLY